MMCLHHIHELTKKTLQPIFHHSITPLRTTTSSPKDCNNNNNNININNLNIDPANHTIQCYNSSFSLRTHNNCDLLPLQLITTGLDEEDEVHRSCIWQLKRIHVHWCQARYGILPKAYWTTTSLKLQIKLWVPGKPQTYTGSALEQNT